MTKPGAIKPMHVDRAVLVQVLELLKAQERYHRAVDLAGAMRDHPEATSLRQGRQSPLTQETIRLREDLELALADAPPG